MKFNEWNKTTEELKMNWENLAQKGTSPKDKPYSKEADYYEDISWEMHDE
jgi:hypothetical protein